MHNTEQIVKKDRSAIHEIVDNGRDHGIEMIPIHIIEKPKETGSKIGITLK